jgi:hypothetical protein
MVTRNAADEATGASGTVLQGQGVGTASAFSTATYPATTTVSQLLYSSATNTVSGLATANRGVLTTGTTGIPVMTALATDGQLIIGSTAGSPSASTLTAGTGISITNASNSITIAVSGSTVGETITGDTGGALSPTAGNWNINAKSTAGSSVSFSGSSSTLSLNTSDSHSNTIVGSGAGNGTLSGNRNTGLGVGSLAALTSGIDNTAIGYHALTVSTSTGAGNEAFGSSSMALLTTGTGNSAYGAGSLGALLTGSQNYAFGQNAGSSYVGAESSNIVIGNTGTAAESNTIRIGTQGNAGGQQNKCFIAGIEGVSVSNLNIVTINTSTGQLGSQAAANVGTVTQFDVLVGGASGAIASVGPGSSGQVLQSAGNAANPAYSTATYPSTATGTGTILRADGTNWSATTATYPNTTTSQQILYSTAANVVGQLTTANSALAATNSSGTLAMRAFSVVIQTFTGTGTYTPTTGMLYCVIQCVGGGGAGGGAAATSATQNSFGGGGQAGEYAVGVFSAATIGASQSVTIGAGGTGVAGTTGNAGGNTSVGSTLISANGGGGGGTATGTLASPAIAPGASGGTSGTGGSYRTTGPFGGMGMMLGVLGFYYSGAGAASVLSTSTLPLIDQATSTGNAGNLYGGGGGGGGQQQSQAGTKAGGAGANGIVIVTEYVIA